MPELPPILRDQRKIDSDQLSLLSVLHYVAAGLAVLGLFGIAGHYALMRTFFMNPQVLSAPNPAFGNSGPPPQVLAVMQWFYFGAAAFVAICGLINVLSGLYIHRRQHRTFSLIVAAVNLLFMPIGTVIGVIAFVILMRDTVREQYEAEREIYG